jgi:hypothetical protein
MTMKKLEIHVPSLLAGVLASTGLFLVLGLGRPAEESGRYVAAVSDDGQTIVLVDSATGQSWIRFESGRAVSEARFLSLGGPH